MPKMVFYTLGRQPQYGRSRWDRYESLRVSGFTKYEARELSRGHREEGTRRTVWSPQRAKVIEGLRQDRERLVNKFASDTGGRGSYQQFIRHILSWYDRGGHTSRQGKRTPANRGGRPDLMQAYHDKESQLARREGWRKGKYTPPPPEDSPEFDDWHEQEVQRKRRRKKSPTAKYYKGNVKAQRERAKTRSQAFKDLVQSDDDSPSVRAQKRQWIKGLKATAKREPDRSGKLLQQARSLGYTGRSF